MKRFLSLALAFLLMCGMLTACSNANFSENANSIINKANAVLETTPYTMTAKMQFDTDNAELKEAFSMMNFEIPVTVDGKNIAMDMSMDLMGQSAKIKATIVDMVMYYDIQVMGQKVKMKATMSEEEYQTFLAESNTEMIVNPEDFTELTVEEKDGKKFIACGKISEAGLAELNKMMENALNSVDGKASISDISYGVTLNDGKYEAMDMSCVYSVTVGQETCSVTFKMRSDFSYENVAKITPPADANQYQEVGYGELMG